MRTDRTRPNPHEPGRTSQADSATNGDSDVISEAADRASVASDAVSEDPDGASGRWDGTSGASDAISGGLDGVLGNSDGGSRSLNGGSSGCPSDFPNLRLFDHPLIQHKLSYIREKTTGFRAFDALQPIETRPW